MSKVRKFYTDTIDRVYFQRVEREPGEHLPRGPIRHLLARRDFTKTVEIDEFPESVLAEIREKKAEEAE